MSQKNEILLRPKKYLVKSKNRVQICVQDSGANKFICIGYWIDISHRKLNSENSIGQKVWFLVDNEPNTHVFKYKEDFPFCIESKI